MWEKIQDALIAELSDLADPGEITRVVVRLFIAAVLGGILGFDRERKGKAAGMRTHMLVAMGAAFFVIGPKFSGMSDDGIARVLQGLVAGVGFLCAGSIIKADDEAHTHGLTTAAGLWLTAAIGTAVGLGRDATAILCTALALVVLSVVPKIQSKNGSSKN